jgi:hypothetical protein
VTKRTEIPRELGDVFSVGDARSLGVSKARLRAPALRGALHGARRLTQGDPIADRFELRQRELHILCREYAAVARAPFAFSHATAARLWGLAVPERVERLPDLHVSVTEGQPRRAGVLTHRVRDLDTRHHRGLPLVPPEQAWLQLSGTLSLDELIVAGDSAVRRKRPLSSLHLLEEIVASNAGQRGVASARRALDDVRSGTDSRPESRVRLILVRAGLPEPIIGHTVHHEGYWVGTPDLAYVREKVAIEYQGSGHRQEDVFEEDIDRLERFREAGWTVIQITKRHLGDPRALAERVRRALAAAGARV